ncbi:hypothetical protein [Clostridium tertium]|uniref:Uncharacterized protein n=1 Tax=Clostridium tertium TaxID=1559 RepID=A0A6N3F5U3_9CLOT
MEVLSELYKNITVKKAVYFIKANRVMDFDVISLIKMVEDEYSSLLIEAINEIKLVVSKTNLDEVVEYVYLNSMYHYHLYKEGIADINVVLLSLMTNFFNYKDIWEIPLEEIPLDGKDKYKLTNITNNNSLNYEGVFFLNKFYYYNPIFIDKVTGKDLSVLLDQLNLLSKKGNSISLRLDETLSVRKEKYKEKVIVHSELYQGEIINLDKIEFPFYRGKNETLCVYNPNTMKKIQFKISHRKDSEKWIEIEEILGLVDGMKNRSVVTKYLHSIFNEEGNNFTHIDGSLNFYDRDNYRVRQSQNINAHSDLHEKLWLIEGSITIKEWGKLILGFFRDDELIFDAFEGNLVEEVFEDILL